MSSDRRSPAAGDSISIMMRRTLLATLVAGAACLGGCKDAPSEEQCKQLLDHLVELEFKKAGTASSNDTMKAEMVKQKKAVTEAKASEFIEACTTKTARARVECALSATDIDKGVAACDQSK